MPPRKPRRTAESVSSPQSEPEVDMVRAVRLVQQISTIVSNTEKHYWLSPDDRSSSLHECFSILEGLLASCPQVTVRTYQGAFTINGRTMEYSDTLIAALLGHLDEMDVDNFAFMAGATCDEFSKFCEVISATPAELRKIGDFATVLERFNVEHIRSKRLIYKAISDADVVVNKNDLEEMADKGAGTGGGTSLAGDILAFIKGDVASDNERLGQMAKEAASDPERMAELILQAAELRDRPAGTAEGETLGDFVVACLRRTYEGMRQEPAFDTPKGRKKAARNLLLLEEEIVRRMREMEKPEWTENDLDEITDATEEITDELKIDSLAEEYAAKRDAAAEAESRLVDMIKSAGTTPDGKNPVLEKLAQRGLAPTGWRELVVKSAGGGNEKAGRGPGPGPFGGSPGILEAISHLDSLLDTMEKQFDKLTKSQKSQEAQKMLGVLENVSTQVMQLTTQTGLAIQTLVQNVQKDAKTAQIIEASLQKAGHPLSMSRKDVCGTVAQILGEIAEPIELVRTSLDMMQSKAFADHPDIQKNVVRLAYENTELARTLLDDLRKISAAASGPGEAGR